MDLDNFFDRVNHDMLMARVSAKVDDERVLALIGKYLRAGIMANGINQPKELGTPQGSPLSPLFSNVLLDDLDKELENRGHRFVRYADDGVTRMQGRKRCRRSINPSNAAQVMEVWPSAAAVQAEAANHCKLRWSGARVVSVAEKAHNSASGVNQEDERKQTIR